VNSARARKTPRMRRKPAAFGVLDYPRHDNTVSGRSGGTIHAG
jgi:hypothetical protein